MEHFDLAAFYGGSATELYRTLGAHRTPDGWVFRVWAPHAGSVSVVGDFCAWDPTAHPMRRLDGGIWETEVAGLSEYDTYKFAVTAQSGAVTFKADPYAFHAETRPGTASKLYELAGYDWGDGAYLAAKQPVYDRPLNIYEVHLGSWRRRENGDFYDYRSLADELSEYAADLGYNCVELMPVTEYPLDDSWGYQCTGYFAPTSRYGTPHDFMYFVDMMHRRGISVILDWVPAHFCKDKHGLIDFDGEPCYEYADPKKREHAGWGTRVFDYGRGEVKSFLLSSAAYWLREYHLDGLRVDAVASMLYLDYGREAGEWTPNKNGGHENLEAIDFLRALNTAAFAIDPNVMMVAEESTAWPLVTYPVSDGGLGFNLKWNMGWMNDMLCYCSADPFFRKDMHDKITFSFMYAFSENYILPLSHDEVVHGKCSLISKMPPPYENQFGGLRALYGYMAAHPGKKMLFMGGEFAQFSEWAYQRGLDWMLLDYPAHRQMQAYVKALNHFYLATPQLWEQDTDWRGFEWISHEDNRNNIIAFRRVAKDGSDIVVVVNFSPEEQQEYRIGVPITGTYEEIFTSDKTEFGGSGMANGKLKTENKPMHGQEQSIVLKIPRFGVLFFKGKARAKRRTKAEIEAAKAAAAKKPVKRTRSTKAVAKSGTKAVARTTEKAVAKTGSKSVAKTTEKAVARTGTKAVAKTTEKAVTRTGTKAVAKATEKAVSVPTDKAVTATGG